MLGGGPAGGTGLGEEYASFAVAAYLALRTLLLGSGLTGPRLGVKNPSRVIAR